MVDKDKLESKFNKNVKLSDREIEILQLTCQEHTSTEIAEKLFISTRTVEGHRYKMLEKIGARNTVGLVIFAFENKLVELEK